MNVLWIEDFGYLQSDSPTLINFFKGLIPEESFDNHWGKETRLSEVPFKLKEFFSQHSETHALNLLCHYGDFLDLTRSNDIVGDYDVAAIDINLSRGVPKDVLLPEGYADPDAFHKKAGFYIYHQLIRMGFPDDRICFLTGEKESTFEELADHCRLAMMPLPKAFGKDDVGMSDFRRWLDEHRKSDYVTLRRGVIEGCKTLREIAQRPDCIQFNRFRPNDPVSVKDMDDYLLSLSRFLPPKRPRNDDSPRTLRLLTRAVVHEWEGDSESESGAHPKHISEKENRPLHGMGWVMKTARNWMAHSQVLNGLTPQDVAYLFEVNMRTMFFLPPQVQRYEKILLSAFQSASDWPGKSVIKEALEESYRQVEVKFRKAGGEGTRYNFQRLANDTQKVGADLDYSILLYQILWHQLAHGKFDPGLKAYISNCDDSAFRLGIGGDDFLRMLLMAIYARSFAG